MPPAPPAKPAIGPHEIFTARWAARRFVQGVLVLVGLVVFAVLAFATDLGGSIGMGALGLICAAVGIVIYFPLAWAAVRWVDKRLAALKAR